MRPVCPTVDLIVLAHTSAEGQLLYVTEPMHILCKEHLCFSLCVVALHEANRKGVSFNCSNDFLLYNLISSCVISTVVY